MIKVSRHLTCFIGAEVKVGCVHKHAFQSRARVQSSRRVSILKSQSQSPIQSGSERPQIPEPHMLFQGVTGLEMTRKHWPSAGASALLKPIWSCPFPCLFQAMSSSPLHPHFLDPIGFLTKLGCHRSAFFLSMGVSGIVLHCS